MTDDLVKFLDNQTRLRELEATGLPRRLRIWASRVAPTLHHVCEGMKQPDAVVIFDYTALDDGTFIAECGVCRKELARASLARDDG